MIAAILLVVVIGLLLLFQLVLAAGAPWGRFAWGGQHAGVLPTGYRIASVVAALVYAAIGLVVLDLAGVVEVLPNAVSQVLAWVVFGFFALGVVLNAISRSKLERYTMTPVALVLAVLSFLVALTGPLSQSVIGMALDVGAGAPTASTASATATSSPMRAAVPIVRLAGGWHSLSAPSDN